MNEKQLIFYARLLLLRGVNLKENQDLLINAPISAQDFVRAIVQEAYKTFKSGMVHINWQDPVVSRLTYKFASDRVLEDFPSYIADRYRNVLNRGAAFLTISSSMPGFSKNLDNKRVQTAQQTMNKHLKSYQEEVVSKHKWTNAPYPSTQWAKAIYPDKSSSDALMQMHEDFITMLRLDTEKPLEAWTNHLNTLEKRRQTLNDYRFKRLKYKSKTMDLTVELPEAHIWMAAAQKRGDDVFVSNMPTEEIFTAPIKTGVNGTVTLTRPLSLKGAVLNPFSLTFKYGEVIHVEGEQKDQVNKLLSMHKNASFLGEVALVPKENPISQLNKVYMHNLIDENATSHIALGNAYPINVKKEGAKNLSEVYENHKINHAPLHIDLMVGSDDLEVTGVLEDGKEIPIFKNGTWSKHFK